MRSVASQSVAWTAGPLLALVACATPAGAQAVTFADLAGSVVDADVQRRQVIRRKGKPVTVTIRQTWKLAVGDDKTVEHTVNTIAHTPKGEKKAKPNIGTFILGEAQAVKSRGGGQAIWNFADGALIFVRTFPEGAFRARFAFAREGSKLTCAVTEGFAREGGKGEIEMQSEFGPVTIVSSKQLSSTCKVGKRR